jgi:hypothetical protein
MPITHGESQLHQLARQLIDTGVLPDTMPEKAWGGYGDGSLCSVCRNPVTPEEVEYEVRIRTESGGATRRFHVVCHAVWRLEYARASAR